MGAKLYVREIAVDSHYILSDEKYPVEFVYAGQDMFCVLGGITLLAHIYNLNNIKSKTVGDGQHGTARFSTKAELRRIYKQVPFAPEEWRRKAQKHSLQELPQGIIVGCRNKGGETIAMVDDADVHCMMVGAAGCGKTAYWLYPNLEYACASGMSFLTTDTKGARPDRA